MGHLRVTLATAILFGVTQALRVPIFRMRMSARQPGSEEKSSVYSQASLIAGTTIGGGFMTLPAATAPVGGASSALGLTAVWGYLLWAALTLNSAIFRLKQDSSTDTKPLSMITVMQKCLGPIVATSAAAAFLVPLSDMVLIVENRRPQLLACLRSYCLYSYIHYGVSGVALQHENVERINDTLTVGMVRASLLCVFCAAKQGRGLTTE